MTTDPERGSRTASADDVEEGPAARVRPLHQRLVAVGVRTAAVVVATLPLVLLVGVAAGLEGALAWGVGFGALGLGLFACERRDAPGLGVAVRSLLAGGLALIVGPLAWLGLSSPGDVQGSIGALGRGLEEIDVPTGLALLVLLATPFLFLYLRVRTRTERASPQAGAALLAGAPVALGLLVAHPCFVVAWLGAGPLVGAAVARVDRALLRWDPEAARPQLDGNVWGVALAVATGGIGVVGCLFFLVAASALAAPPRGHAGGIVTHDLRDLAAVQSRVYAAAERRTGTPAYAGNLAALGERGRVGRALADGLQEGHVFRLVRAPGGDAWAAAADPVAPRGPGALHFFVNHHGVVWQSSDGPARLDPETCAVPTGPGWRTLIPRALTPPGP